MPSIQKTIPDHNQCDPGLSFLNILPLISYLNILPYLAAGKDGSLPAKRRGAYACSNSRRKRVSFSEKRRRSLTRYLRLVMRSTPSPKA